MACGSIRGCPTEPRSTPNGANLPKPRFRLSPLEKHHNPAQPAPRKGNGRAGGMNGTPLAESKKGTSCHSCGSSSLESLCRLNPPWMSFPRKRESSYFFWVPACAGMTHRPLTPNTGSHSFGASPCTTRNSIFPKKPLDSQHRISPGFASLSRRLDGQGRGKLLHSANVFRMNRTAESRPHPAAASFRDIGYSWAAVDPLSALSPFDLRSYNHDRSSDP